MSRFPMLPVLVAVLAGLLLLAAPARAAELYVVVDATTTTGERVPVKVRTGSDGRVLARAWRLKHPEALLDAGVALDRGETLAWLDPLARETTPAQRELRQAARLVPALVGSPHAVRGNVETTLDLELSEPGLYLVAVSLGDETAYATALVSDLAVVAKPAGSSLLVWTVHRTTGRPVPGATVRVRGVDGAWQQQPTDASGLATFADGVGPGADVRAAWKDVHLAFGRTTWHGAASRDRRVYLYSHQPAYRPGERVEVKGILRAADGAALRLDPDVTSLTVRLLAPDGSEAAKADEVAVSAGMGTFAAAFDLPEAAPTGRWSIVADLGTASYAAPLVVDAYEKPSFEVTARAADLRVLVGGTTTFQVEARFYDGGVVADAPVSWQLAYQRFDRELFPEDELVQLFFGTEREAYRPVTLVTGTAVLDGEGRLAVPVDVPADLLDGTLTLRATVTGPDRVAVVGSGRVAVSAAPLYVDLASDRHLYGPEDVAQVQVVVERADGAPAAGRTGVVTVGLAPETAGGAPSEETWLHTLPFTTDAEGRARLEAPLANAGRYAISVTVPRAGDEPPGDPAFATIHVWAVGERATPGTPGADLRVVADRDHYAVGDTARLLVLPGGGARPVLATLEREGVIRQAVLDPGEAAPVWQVPLTEADVPDVYATFTAVDHGRLLTTTHVLRIPPRTRLLTTTLAPDAPELEPGATSGLAVEVTDAEGRGVEGAEVSVAVVDEALFAQHADPTAPIEAFFHPPVRNAVGTEGFLDWRSVGWVAPALEGKLDELVVTESGTAAGRGGRFAGPSGGAPPAPSSPAPSPAMEPPAGSPAEGGADVPEAVTRDVEVADHEEAEEALGGDKNLEDGVGDALTVREDFRTAVHWTPALTTGADGRARIDGIRYGDSLTRWRLSARSVDAASRVGSATAFVRTRKSVTTRMSPPRFLRDGDRAEMPVLLRNLTDGELEARWRVEGDLARAADGALRLPAGSTRVVEVGLEAGRPAEAALEARVRTADGGDAERRTLPVLPQGIPKVEGGSLWARGGETSTGWRVPEHAEPGTVSLHVAVEPAYLQALLAALPYLLDYPYGCTEQTMNRFLPLLAAAETVKALGLEPTGRLAEADRMIASGLDRLGQLQHEDGGFGWWERDASDPGMTALVVRGLARVVALDPQNARALAMRDRAVAFFLADGRMFEGDPATNASVLVALAEAGRLPLRLLPAAGDPLYASLPPLVLALRLRTAVALDRRDLVAAIAGLLDDEARRSEDGLVWWSAGADTVDEPTRWQDDAVETTAQVLRALVQAGARFELLDGAARWLLRHRDGGDRWRSTRDTGSAVEALAALTSRTGDLGAGREVTLKLDDRIVFQGALSREDAVAGRGVVDVGALSPGQEVTVSLDCPEGSALASIALRYHETGPAIAASSHGFSVTRRYFQLVPREAEGRVTWTRTPVTETVPSGTLVECEIVVETPSAREYVMVTSPHPAGFEPAREVAMDVPGRAPASEARTERYDDRTMFFPARLPPGRVVFRHLLRATHVGTFTAIPAQVELMYFPDVRGNSQGEVWSVSAAGPVGTDGAAPARKEDR